MIKVGLRLSRASFPPTFFTFDQVELNKYYISVIIGGRYRHI